MKTWLIFKTAKKVRNWPEGQVQIIPQMKLFANRDGEMQFIPIRVFEKNCGGTPDLDPPQKFLKTLGLLFF
jgi:hypothetical protein